MREKCPAFGQKCHNCEKVNHYKKCCKSKPRSYSHSKRNNCNQSVHEVTVEEPTTHREDTFYVDGVDIERRVDGVNPQAKDKEEGFVTIHINGITTEMKVDTGAKCNVLSQETFTQVTNGEQLVKQETAINLVAYGGSRIETKGLVILPCCLKEQHHSLPFFIVNKDVQPLLGFRACVDMGIVTLSKDVHQITTESNTDFTTQTLMQYKDLFDDELGELPITYSMTVDPSVQPG